MQFGDRPKKVTDLTVSKASKLIIFSVASYCDIGTKKFFFFFFSPSKDLKNIFKRLEKNYYISDIVIQNLLCKNIVLYEMTQKISASMVSSN